MVTFLQIAAALLSFAGYYYINKKNIFGYALFLKANIFSIILSLCLGLWFQAIMFAVFIYFNIDGIRQWKRSAEEEMCACQDETDIKMQEELDLVADILKGKTYEDYCTYEDEVAELIEKHCPMCKKELEETVIGRAVLQADIRNYIRFKGNIQF